MFKLVFDTKNAAFEDSTAEIARILRELAEKAEQGHAPGPEDGDGVVRDINGNAIGRWVLSGSLAVVLVLCALAPSPAYAADKRDTSRRSLDHAVKDLQDARRLLATASILESRQLSGTERSSGLRGLGKSSKDIKGFLVD